MPIKVIAINATLKKSGKEPSSTDAMIDLVAGYLEDHDATLVETIRLAADVLIFGTPIWMGQPSSIAKRAMERMDAFLSETDDAGRTPAYGKVAVFAIVGNEDGAHFSTAAMAQSLNDVGWTIPAASACYWVGEAMHKKDFRDLAEVPKITRETAAMVASNAVHLAELLKSKPYPALPS